MGKRIIRIDLLGRKRNRNVKPYYTLIGHDTVEALREYLHFDRGPVKPGEPIFLNDKGYPLKAINIRG